MKTTTKNWATLTKTLAASCLLCQTFSPARGIETTSVEKSPPASTLSPTLEPGHSFHGESFDEGPRQASYLMSGMSNVHWAISTKSPMAQRFFDQGIGQLHGFWYFEAERSFRQVAAMDPDCAMAYWGLARANTLNDKRASGFIAEAVKRIEKASPLESRLIQAMSERLKESDKSSTEKKRLEAYVTKLEELASEHPDNIELQVMLVLQMWENEKEGLKIQSRLSVDAMLDKIFSINPRHPAHHFRIHLWDNKNRNRALASAAACGPAAPGIAHMWHMPGHTYTGLKRYHDAAWQQEASARVDHAHMIRDRVMPDQIHNFSHNNEWLIRTWSKTGQVRRGIELAKNMCSLPRHPEYNTLEKGSANFGRKRLISVTTQFGCWEELLALADSAYLPATDDKALDDERLTWMAVAHAMLGNSKNSVDVQNELSQRLIESIAETAALEKECYSIQARYKSVASKRSAPTKIKSSNINRAPQLLGAIKLDESDWDEVDFPKTSDRLKEFSSDLIKSWTKAEKDKVADWKKVRERVDEMQQQLSTIQAFQAASDGDYRLAIAKARLAGKIVPNHYRVGWYSEAGYHRGAMEKAREFIKEDPQDVLRLSNGVWVAWQANEREQAKRWASDFLKASVVADENVAAFHSIRSILAELGMSVDRKVELEPASDIGDRPSLDSLGPERWSPSMAPNWSLEDGQGKTGSSKEYRNRPYIVIFYLGLGCLHCVEQLQAMSPLVEKFKAAGVDVVAISTEDPKSLREGLANYGKSMEIPLFSNPEQDVFKNYRCFDDFENQPLHGTFLIDANGRVRWQDIGPEPFMQLEFLLNESKRLLALDSSRE